MRIIFPRRKERLLAEWISALILLIFFLILILYAYGLPLSGHFIWSVTDLLMYVLEIGQGDVSRVFGYYVGTQLFIAICVHAIFVVFGSWFAINVFLKHFFIFQAKKEKNILVLKYLTFYLLILLSMIIGIFIL